MPDRMTPEEIFKRIDILAGGECPLDDKEELTSKDDEHQCPVCLSRSAYNTIAAEMRYEYKQIMKLVNADMEGGK